MNVATFIELLNLKSDLQRIVDRYGLAALLEVLEAVKIENRHSHSTAIPWEAK